MSQLEEELGYAIGFKCLYAFSKRVSIEEPQTDGSVVKKNVFKHIGFTEV